MPTLRSLPPAKKRKIATEDNGSKQLEDEIAKAVEAGTSLNPLADLVALLLSTPDPQDVSKAIYALYRSFVLVITSGKLTPPSSDAAAKTVKTWIWEHLNTYTDFLVGLMKDEEKHLRVSALKILMSLQKHLSSKVSTDGNPQFHLAHFKKIVAGLVLCPRSKRQGSQDVGPPGVLDMDVLNTFYETWLSVHDDIRWFFLRESATLLNKTPSSSKSPSVATITRNLLSILEKLDTFPTDSAELNAWWVPELGTKPPKPKKLKGVEGEEDMGLTEKTEEDEDDDDWRKFFDDEPAKDASKDTKKPTGRLHELTLHQSLHHLGSHRAVFTRCWLVLLPLITSAPEGDVSSTKTPAKAMSGSEGTTGESKKGTRKALSTRVLNILHAHILPHLTRPILVMDWVGNCVDMGGSVGLLALNGLWGLMKGYNLDYPSFYTRLYAFLDRDVLHLKHRARFFRLTEVFLSSTHVPSTLLASFIKRLSRLSLNAPPAAIIMLIPFTYNVLKKHPALMAMIHRDLSEDEDPFDPLEPNPLSTNALSSSLWELYSHRTHYHATVSTLCKIFAEAFTKPNYSVEDFLDHGYGTLFETEVNRKIKKDPPLAMQSGRKIDLFPVAVEDVEVEGAVGDGIGGDLVQRCQAFDSHRIFDFSASHLRSPLRDMLGLLEGYYPSRFPSSPEPEEEQEAILTEWGQLGNEAAELCRPLKTEEEFTALVLQTINADPAAPREYLSYFLIYATSPNIGYLDAITTLLKHGARIDQSAIRWAIHTRPNERAIQILQMYLEAGWNINQQIMSSGDALWEAVANQNDDLVKWLLEHGANPASGELAYGVPGLAFAAMKASPEVVTMLVEMGKLPIKNSRALEMAAKVGRVDNVVQLLELGAEVNSVTVRSKEVWWIETNEMDEGIGSALHFAASAGHVEVVKVLLEWGADLDLQDSKGFTPLQRARQAWKFGVVKVLWDSRR